MECLEDSKACLLISQSMLKEIKKAYKDCLLKDKPPSTFKVTIKNFLENVRSALEYPINYIFHTYCSVNYTEKELKNKKIYFPIRRDKKYFDKCIDKNFRGLRETKLDIYQILENCQSFNGKMWTQYLTILSNENKHIKLTRQQRNESGHIKYMEDVFGNKIINCNIVNCNHSIVYNNKPIYSANDSPFIKKFDAIINVDYLFEGINKPVILVLNDIYAGAISVINGLEKIL
jgi:hypothetical protein